MWMYCSEPDPEDKRDAISDLLLTREYDPVCLGLISYEAHVTYGVTEPGEPCDKGPLNHGFHARPVMHRLWGN